MVQKFKTLADVVALAEFAHRNQTDKAGMPYIKHPMRVMQNVQAQGAMPYVQMAAVLHDVTEDTAFTADMLLELGVPEAAVEVVRLVDRNESKAIYENMGDPILQFRFVNNEGNPRNNGEFETVVNMTKDEYYYRRIRSNPAALQVKLADIGDNLQPWRLAYLPQEKQDYLRNKYALAIKMLTE